MRRALMVFLITLLLFGCSTPPKRENISVKDPEEQKRVPARGSKEEKFAVEKIALPSKETSFFADGTLDEYVIYFYEEDGTRLIKKETYDARDELLDIVDYEYQKGMLSRQTNRDSKGNIRSYHVYSYNSSGELSSVTRFNAKDEAQTVSEYEYGTNGKKLQWNLYDGSGALLEYTTYRYENEMNTRIDIYTPSGRLDSYSTSEYDSDSNEIKRSFFSPSGRLEKHQVYDYEDGRRSRESFFIGNNFLVRKLAYLYDSEGNVIKIHYFDKEGKLREIKEREYIYREVKVKM